MAVGRRERQRHGYRGHDVDGDYHRQAGRIQRRSGGRGRGPRRRDPGAQDAHHAGGHSPVVHKHDRSRHLLPIHRRAAEDASSSPDGHAARRLSKGIRTATASPSTPVRKHRQTHAPVRTNTSTVSPTTSSPKSLAEGPTPEPTRTEPTSTSWLTPNAASAPPRSTGGTSSTRLRAPRATDSPHHA